MDPAWTPEAIRSARLAAGWDAARLARELKRAAGREATATTESLTRSIRNWEAGRTRPRERYRLLLDRLLGPAPSTQPPAPGEGAAEEPGSFPAPGQAWTAAGALTTLKAVVADGDGITRRALLVAAGAQAGAHVLQWALAEPAEAARAGTGPVSPGMVAAVEAGIAELRMADAARGSAGLVPLARPQLVLLHRLLESGPDAATALRLHAAAADLAGLIGWMLVDAGEHAAAQRYFAAGLRSAHAAGAPVLGAGIASYVAVQSYGLGAGREAALLAHTALARASGPASPHVEAMLHTRAARGHAVAGDPAAAERALERARECFVRGPSSDDPEWLYWMSPGEMHAQAAGAHLELGEHGRAHEELAAASRSFGPGCVRDRAMCAIRQAGALVGMGELDGACERAHAALDLAQGVGSARLAEKVEGFLSAARGGGSMVDDVRERAALLWRSP